MINEYIDKSGLKKQFIADKLDITYQSLNNKISGRTEFTVSEALTLKSMLNISDTDFSIIFSKYNK